MKKKTNRELLEELTKRVAKLEKQDKQTLPYRFPKEEDTLHPLTKHEMREQSDCMHDNCPGCLTGTCSGVHMVSCPCRKCTPWS